MQNAQNKKNNNISINEMRYNKAYYSWSHQSFAISWTQAKIKSKAHPLVSVVWQLGIFPWAR